MLLRRKRPLSAAKLFFVNDAGNRIDTFARSNRNRAHFDLQQRPHIRTVYGQSVYKAHLRRSRNLAVRPRRNLAAVDDPLDIGSCNRIPFF